MPETTAILGASQVLTHFFQNLSLKVLFFGNLKIFRAVTFFEADTGLAVLQYGGTFLAV